MNDKKRKRILDKFLEKIDTNEVMPGDFSKVIDEYFLYLLNKGDDDEED